MGGLAAARCKGELASQPCGAPAVGDGGYSRLLFSHCTLPDAAAAAAAEASASQRWCSHCCRALTSQAAGPPVGGPVLVHLRAGPVLLGVEQLHGGELEQHVHEGAADDAVGDVVGEGHAQDGDQGGDRLGEVVPVDLVDGGHEDEDTNQNEHRAGGDEGDVAAGARGEGRAASALPQAGGAPGQRSRRRHGR